MKGGSRVWKTNFSDLCIVQAPLCQEKVLNVDVFVTVIQYSIRYAYMNVRLRPFLSCSDFV